MGSDICLAPGCGSFMADDSKPCIQCSGRGYNQALDGGPTKVPWTNYDWVKYRSEMDGEWDKA